MRRKRKNRSKKKSTGLGLIFVMVFLIGGLLMIKKQDLNQRQILVYSRMEELEEALEEEQEISKALEEQEVYMETRKFIEEIARDKFGLVYEDEYVFKAKEE